MKKVKDHFEEEAAVFDSLIETLIPHYKTMSNSLILSLPFHPKESFKILDLGCGTGNISLLIKEKFPKSDLTCLDISENMIKQTKSKLVAYKDVKYLVKDLRELDVKEQYDAILSSLAIHHLHSNEQKSFYKQCYEALRSDGVFFNADILTSSIKSRTDVYLKKWTDFMREHHSEETVKEIWLAKHYDEDNPQSLINHLKWMENAGFREIDVIWKYYYFGVYGGMK